MNPSWVTIIYGVITAALGAQAYLAPREGATASPISLIAGGVSGLLLIAAGFAMFKGAFTLGWWIALIVTLLLLVQFAGGIFRGKFDLYPQGLMVLLSLVALIALIFGRTAGTRAV